MVDCHDLKLEQLPHFLKSYITWWELDLSNNLIDKLNSGDFQPFKTRHLKLNNNGLVSIRQSALNNLGYSLDTLDLSDNNLHLSNAIEDGAFDELTGLKRLYLQNNVIKDLPNVPGLENLNLDANTFKDFPDFVRKYEKLRSLSLKGNDLEVIPDEVFSDLPDLNDLDLTFNNIKSMNACAILPHRIRAVYLDNNPQVNCDCQLFWLQKAGIKLSKDEKGFDALCPNKAFTCEDATKFCNLSPTDIPPRGTAIQNKVPSVLTLFSLFITCMYISKHHLQYLFSS